MVPCARSIATGVGVDVRRLVVLRALGPRLDHPTLKSGQIYLRALPVGLVTVSTMLMGVTVSVEHTTETAVQKYYGHTESIPEYFLFLGTIMYTGTLVPDMFDGIRLAGDSSTNTG